MTAPVALAAADYPQAVLASATPSLLYFTATWCGPCRQFGPVVEQVAAELAGRVNVFKVDIDASAELAQQFGIASVPAVHVIRDAQTVAAFIGPKPKAALLRVLADALD